MILKASQRGGGMALAAHLLKSENEHVEVHEIAGFVAGTVPAAMKEAEAVAKGTRCKQHLFSVSLNPPANENVAIDVFEAAIERIEAGAGLTGQPRIVIFHEKEGRRHAHCVWSRIDADTMTARPLPFFKIKLREISKGFYLEHGWQMPRGLVDSKERDPHNFSLAEWQQAKRMGRDAGALKAAIQECWTVSGSRTAFAQALESRGLYLAQGDRRAHVAVTYEGEVVSIAKMVGIKTKDITARLGKPDAERDVTETRAHIANIITPRLGRLIGIADQTRAKEITPLEERRIAMKDQHTLERQRLDDGQKARSIIEARERAMRLRGGIARLWDRLTGQRGRVVKQNEAEAFTTFRRDRDQRGELIADQLRERRVLQREIIAVRHRYTARVTELDRDIARQTAARDAGKDGLSMTFDQAIGTGRSAFDAPRVSQARVSGRGGNHKGSRGPDLGL